MEVTHKIDPRDGVVLFVSVHGMRIAFTESEWAELQNAREALMQPIWDARKKAEEAEYLASYHREHNIRSHTDTIEGVQVLVTTQGQDNAVSSIVVGEGDKPRIRTSRAYSNGKSTSWNVEYFDQRVANYSPHHPYATLRNKRGAAIAFKTPQAAIRAAIRQELLTEAI